MMSPVVLAWPRMVFSSSSSETFPRWATLVASATKFPAVSTFFLMPSSTSSDWMAPSISDASWQNPIWDPRMLL